MHAFVKQKMATVGGARLIHHPKLPAKAEAVFEDGQAAISLQQAGGAESLGVDHQTAGREPTALPRLGDAKVPTPHIKRLVEHSRQFIDAVAFAHGPVGHEHEVLALEHPQSGPPRRRGKVVSIGRPGNTGNAVRGEKKEGGGKA
ncbi:MAG: hypothetical protein ACKOHG_18540 [Planctomycetia bacterium]